MDSDHNEYDKAISDFRKAIELDLNDAKAYMLRGEEYKKKGAQRMADADFAKAKELGWQS